MVKYILTSQADADLEAIFIYTATEWGVAQAERYLYELDSYMQKLADGELAGKDCAKLISQGRRLFYYHANRHYIIYRKSRKVAEIITIYHDRMDLEYHLSRL